MQTMEDANGILNSYYNLSNFLSLIKSDSRLIELNDKIKNWSKNHPEKFSSDQVLDKDIIDSIVEFTQLLDDKLKWYSWDLK